MRLDELEYDLPNALIAQEPAHAREEARMIVVTRGARRVVHSRFRKIGDFLREGDLLVVNDTRVIPARLWVTKESGGTVELLMVRPVDDPPGAWLGLVRAHRHLREGAVVRLESGRTLRIVRFERRNRAIIAAQNGAAIDSILAESGAIALPHYIRRAVNPNDYSDYQTVYALATGAIAAPTAGLHFSSELLEGLRQRGIRIASLTLHIGPGTFIPVRTDIVEGHSMEAEWYTISANTAGEIGLARRTGGRLIAVGTSVVRALESYAITGETEGFTALFVCPGFRFKLTEAMVTNFHMPRSTALAMVMAFAGRDLIMAAYREAVKHRYRFLSYGDAMLIL